MQQYPIDQARKNKCENLAELVLQGKSLHIYLKPDDSVKDRDGQYSYIESLDLRHIIVKDQAVWACQDRNVSQFVDETITHTGGYAYSNAIDMFVNFRATDSDLTNTETQQRILLMTTGRYGELEWVYHDDYELIWEYGVSDNYHDLAIAIRQGKKFKVALQDQHGFWNIHPVYYPFYYPDQDRIDFLTNNNSLPALLKTPITEISQFWQNTLGQSLDAFDTEKREQSIEINSPGFWTCYKIFGDGIYQTIEDRKKNTAQKYQALKIFTSK